MRIHLLNKKDHQSSGGLAQAGMSLGRVRTYGGAQSTLGRKDHETHARPLQEKLAEKFSKIKNKKGCAW